MTQGNLEVPTYQALASSSKSEEEIRNWLIEYMAKNLEVSSNQIDISQPFERYNLDSAVIIGMTGELESLLNTILDPTVVYDYPTIDTLAKHLSSGAEIGWKKDLHRPTDN